MDTQELPAHDDDVIIAVNRAVEERAASPGFASVQDLRLRFRRVKGALLCIAAVGLSDGGLATSTATSSSPIDAALGALDGLPDRIGRMTRASTSAQAGTHAGVRNQLKRLLDRA